MLAEDFVTAAESLGFGVAVASDKLTLIACFTPGDESAFNDMALDAELLLADLPAGSTWGKHDFDRGVFRINRYGVPATFLAAIARYQRLQG
jgi:hypothetical protein